MSVLIPRELPGFEASWPHACRRVSNAAVACVTAAWLGPPLEGRFCHMVCLGSASKTSQDRVSSAVLSEGYRILYLSRRSTGPRSLIEESNRFTIFDERNSSPLCAKALPSLYPLSTCQPNVPLMVVCPLYQPPLHTFR